MTFRDDVLEKMSEQEMQVTAREILLRLDGKTVQSPFGSADFGLGGARAAAGFGDWTDNQTASAAPAWGSGAESALQQSVRMLAEATAALARMAPADMKESERMTPEESGMRAAEPEKTAEPGEAELQIPVRRGKRMETAVPAAVSRTVEVRDRQPGVGQASSFSVGRVSACLQKDTRRYDSGYIRY